MADITLYHGDCLVEMKKLADNSIDTTICDPPAGISFMNVKWDGNKGGRDKWIAWLTGVFEEVYRVMKPGGAMLVWALPRTSHWTGTAIENAGFRVIDVITHLFGSGFPKSHSISKALDRAAGAEREVIGKNVSAQFVEKGYVYEGNAKGSGYGDEKRWGFGCDVTAPATPEAKLFDGYGTALKPAAEFWWLSYKPREGRYSDNALKWGVAGLWVDGSRIPTGGSGFRSVTSPWLSILDSVSFDTPESCHDWLLHICVALLRYSSDDKAQEHNVDDLGGISPSGAGYALLVAHLYPNGVWCGLSLNAVRDSRFDCLPCHHLYDALVQMIQEAAQGGAPSLADALGRISRFQLEPLHNHGLDSVHLSSSDVFLCVQALCCLLREFYAAIEYTPPTPKSQMGRYPANLILSHSPDCKRTGVRKVKNNSGSVTGQEPSKSTTNVYGDYGRKAFDAYGENGFETVESWVCAAGCPCGHVWAAQQLTSCPECGCRKTEWVCAVRMLDEQSGTLKSGSGDKHGRKPSTFCASTNWKAYKGTSIGGDIGGASRFFLNLKGERMCYTAKAPQKQRWFYCTICQDAYPTKEREQHLHDREDRNHIVGHPTQKPEALMQFLCKLTRTPTGGTVLDPFMGSGTTGVACVNTHRNFIGIELDESYFAIAEARITHAQQQMVQLELTNEQ